MLDKKHSMLGFSDVVKPLSGPHHPLLKVAEIMLTS